jgi:hypothetical protein
MFVQTMTPSRAERRPLVLRCSKLLVARMLHTTYTLIEHDLMMLGSPRARAACTSGSRGCFLS